MLISQIKKQPDPNAPSLAAVRIGLATLTFFFHFGPCIS